MPDVYVNNATLVTTSATTSPSALTSETWAVTALPSSWPTLTAGQMLRLADATTGATAGQQAELVLLTASSGSGATSITVTRGVEGTTPVAHASSSTWAAVVTKAVMDTVANPSDPLSRLGLGIPTARESFPRFYCSTAVTTFSSNIYLVAVPCVSGDVITRVTFATSTTAATFGSSGYHCWFGLYDSDAATLLRQSSDQTNTAWAASVGKTADLSSSYTVTSNKVLYAAFSLNVGTGGAPAMPTIVGPANFATFIQTTGFPSGYLLPALQTSTGGGTATAPNPVTGLIASSNRWALLS